MTKDSSQSGRWRLCTRALLTWALWGSIGPFALWPFASCPSVTAADPAEPVPSWQSGISRWNGRGYDPTTPARTIADHTSSSTAATPRTTDSPAPYSVPVDPQLNRSAVPMSGARVNEQPISAATPSTAFPAGIEIPLPAASLGEASESPRGTSELLNGPGNLVDPAAANQADADPQSLEPISNTGPADASGSAIADAIESGQVEEPPPLREDVVRWYQYPMQWIRGWKSHAEFGLDGSEGNSTTLAIQTGLETKRTTDLYTLAIDLDYRQASNRGTTTADNGRFNVDYDRLLAGSNWTAFWKFGLEWDRFKAFDLRLNTNGGLGYYWLRDDTTSLVTRFGAGASREMGAPDDAWSPEAVFGLEAERQLTSHQKLKGKIDYFPAWEDFGDYRIVTDVSWEILLDGSENLSLKLAATDRYDSTPQGAEPNDLYYSLLLLYKF